MTTPRVTVPVEPTEAMMKAADAVDWNNEDERSSVINMWQAMLSAAPAPEGGAVAWTPWNGGSNPLPDFGRHVEAMLRNGIIEKAYSSDFRWQHHDYEADIVAYRIPALATREEAPAEAGEIGDALFRALRSYKLTNMACEDDPSIGYPLVDLMSNDGTDISTGEEEMRVLADHLSEALRAQPPAREDAQPALTVWYGSMPESNGRQNWTAILRRVTPTGKWDQGFCFARSEYPERVRYEADRMRWTIGELAERPDILAYDEKKHSGYVAPSPAPDALREANLWWNAEDWEQTFNSLEDAYDEATGGEMRGVAKLGRATEHDPVWALRIDFDTTGDGEADDYEIRLFKSVDDAHAYLATLQAEQGAK